MKKLVLKHLSARYARLAATAAITLATAGAYSNAIAQSPSEYRIGALNPITGAGGPYGAGMFAGIKLAIEDVNRHGGAGGRTLKLFAEDSQTKADAAVLAAKKLIEVNKVDAIAGMWASSVTLAVMPIASAANIIQMHSSGAPEIMRANKAGLAWGFQSPNTVFGWTFAQTALKYGFKRAATLSYNNASALGQAEYFKNAWEKAGNKLVAEVVYEPNQTSYRTELQRVLSTKPDVIVLASYTPDATIILREWYQSGQDAKFIMPGWSASPDLIKALGPTVTNGILSVQNVPASGSAYDRFNEAYKKANKGVEPHIYSAEVYDEIISLALAIEAAGPGASNKEINAAIKQVTNAPGVKVSTFEEGAKLLREGKKINYEGVSSSVEMSDEGFTVPDFGVYEIENGQLVRKDTIHYQNTSGS
ncbi:ABC transporter substrate-binding protein [Pusillimonas sp. TS35]|nr:ABC transporter substrate-binding protein [Pusillimonas sp. TS35]